MPIRSHLHYGFEKEDLAQEMALGRLQAERLHPGNDYRAYSRGHCRVGRWKSEEAKYAHFKQNLRVEIVSRRDEEVAFHSMLLHEILDFLPLVKKEEALRVMAREDGRELRRVGREISEELSLRQKRI